MNLSRAAKSALINGTTHEPVQADTPSLEELKNAGMVGPRDGMTRRGSIERERLLAAAEDKAFGA